MTIDMMKLARKRRGSLPACAAESRDLVPAYE
eukprot:COSAG03_NODE_628_length_6625_cov_9.247165_5_plen_32_part_00